MEIKHKDDGKKGAFYIEMDGKQEAEMTFYHSGPNEITIDHTEVSDKLGGQGVGGKLVTAGVEYLRKNNLKAIPECSFVKSVFDKNGEEYADVRA